MADIWDEITDRTKLTTGDTVRVQFDDPEEYGITSVEGVINTTSESGGFWIGNGSNVDVGIRSTFGATVSKLRPPINLPTAPGSAILVYDVSYLQNVVLTLVQNEGWVNAQWPAESIDISTIEHNFVRVLFDAGA